MKIKKLIFCLFFTFLINNLFAQSDTTFWFAAPEVSFNNAFNSNLDRPIELHITSGSSASIVTISMPANPSFIPIIRSLPANSNSTVDLTAWIDQIETRPSNQIINSGILIRSTAKITAYYEVTAAGCGYCNPELFTLKGGNALGTNFFIPSQNFLDNNPNYSPTPKSAFDIVASEDNTIISITPAKDIVGHAAGTLFSITLNKGQTYSATAVSGLAINHLGGSIVSANKKIAITVKDDLLDGAVYGGCADLGGDQIVPVTLLGSKYIAIRGYLNFPYDKVFVTAVTNNTQVKVDGIIVTTLNAGNTFTISMTNPVTYIETTSPVYVLQLSGFGCEIGIAVLPPIECTGSASLSATRSTSDALFLNILVPSGGQNAFKYNGVTGIITTADFTVVPATAGQWYYASKNISTAITTGGTSFSISNSAYRFQLGVIHGDPGWGCRFGYFSDYNTFKANISANGPLFCTPDTLRLHADSISNTIIQWTGPNGFVSTASNPKKFINSINDNGYYKVVITDPTCGTVTDSVLITFDNTIVTTNNNSTICNGSSIQLNATGAATYSWSPTAGLSNAGIANPIATPLVTTQYIVTGIKPSGCTGKDTVIITVSPTGCNGIGNVINDYTPVLGFDKCKNILTVGDATNYKAGDTVLLIQMKGAIIDSSNTAAFGTITDYKNAGNYEFNYIKSKTGNNIELKNVVTRNYDIPIGKVQLIRVPYYQNAIITATLTCPPWDGTTGGVLVLNAQDSVTLNADIDVSGKGFLGGAGLNTNALVTNCFNNDYNYPANSLLAAKKGESIASISNNIICGKGAPAGGGGGGLDHNSGGGGGGNGGSGGFGGYQLESCGNAPFDNRGTGGKNLTYNTTINKIFMGSGGGAGHANNPGNIPSSGGNGGGIAIIIGSKLKTNGNKIVGNGDAGLACVIGPSLDCHDGMGGGGAGGTVLINVQQHLTNQLVETKGGKGANLITALSAGRIGTGGGGGGGILFINTATLPAQITNTNSGGTGGVIIADANNPWGSTAGTNGNTIFDFIIPIDNIPFKPNIDSVRFNFTGTGCSSFNFSGLAYINSSAITNWQWYFGDGGTASTQNTSHTYSTTGTFTVKLVATDVNGCKDSISRLVTATAIAFDFSYKQDVCNPLSVQFFGAGASLTNPYWSFGDAGTITGTVNPTHIYAATGNYAVKFTVNNAGCNDTISKTISLNVTQADIVLTPDTTICFGTTKLLRAQPSNSFCWSPTTYLNNPLLNNPTTSTPTNITYYYTAEVLGSNLIVNGDFSAGNTGFTSAYTYATPNTVEGQYFIGTNPVAWNPGAAPCTDHTTGSGNMMLVNGAATPGTIVWKETISVVQNTNYNFACWVQSIYFADPAQLQFSINNILIGPIFSPGTVTCNWKQFFSNWNSGNNNTAVISIVNLNTVLGGNDFALDDISFAPVSIKRDSVKITVDTPMVSATSNTTICTGSSAQLNATGAITYSWSPTTGLSNASIANPVAMPAATTTYTVNGTNSNGCTAQSGVTVTVLPAANFDFSYQQNVCNPLSVQFFTAGANPVNPYWSFGDGNTLLGNNPTHAYSSLGNYTVKYHIDNATCPDTITKIISLQLSNADIVLTPDTTICFGSTKLLRAQSSGNFCWSPTTYLNNPALNNPTTSTPTNITYYYTAEVLGSNLIVNGDFSAGNTGFTSAYTYATPNTVEGQYFVGTNPVAWNPGAAPCTDHTTGSGNMMLVNGAPTPGTIVWKETVNVTTNTNYNFACWVQSIYFADPAQLQFSINNILIGPIFSPGSVTCNWQRFFSNWNSGNNTTAIISIVNLNTAVGGNDFALDDISFAPVAIKRDSVKITVDTPVVNTIADVSVCAGIPVQLNATGASTYVWTPATGLSNPNIANPLAIPQTNTRYTVNGTTINGCTASDFIDITVLPKPLITKTADTTICKNSPVQLNASGGTSYTWSPAATLNNANIANPVATPTAPVTKYIVTVTNNNVNACSNTDSVKITLRPAPVFTVSPSKSTCIGTAVQLSAAGGDSYLWNPANLVSNAAIANPTAISGTTTNYSVTITESNCNVSATLFTTVTVNPVPVVTASKSNDIDCSIEFANLLASGASQYTWSPASGLSSNSIYNPVAKPTATTKYVVTGNNSFGCSDSDTLTVAVTKTGASGYFMPNSFTPNGDGKNDCFGIKYWGIIEQLEFFIYNRYGEKVFYTNDPNKCWDGLYKSKKPELGNYVYYIKAKTACGTVEKKGNVILIR